MICLFALLIVVAGLSAADQLQLEMPVSLAARVIAGPTWDGAITLEPKDTFSVKVTVEAGLRAGAWERGARVLWGSVPPETLSVEQFLPLPPELGPVQQASFWHKLVRTVAWVSRNVRLAEDDRGPQDAASVLRRKVGRCSGRANLAVALLRQMGVPARVVHGLFLRSDGAVWHRWGEAWLGQAGWRPFDPGVSVGVVGVRYLPVVGADEGLSLQGVRVISVAEGEFTYLPRIQGLRVPLSLPTFLSAWGGKGL